MARLSVFSHLFQKKRTKPTGKRKAPQVSLTKLSNKRLNKLAKQGKLKNKLPKGKYIQLLQQRTAKRKTTPEENGASSEVSCLQTFLPLPPNTWDTLRGITLFSHIHSWTPPVSLKTFHQNCLAHAFLSSHNGRRVRESQPETILSLQSTKSFFRFQFSKNKDDTDIPIEEADYEYFAKKGRDYTFLTELPDSDTEHKKRKKKAEVEDDTLETQYEQSGKHHVGQVWENNFLETQKQQVTPFSTNFSEERMFDVFTSGAASSFAHKKQRRHYSSIHGC